MCGLSLSCVILLALSRTPEVNRRVQKLKATVSLAETFPLSLQDQIMPIIDLMVGPPP